MTGLKTWLRTPLGLVLKFLVKSMLLPEWAGVRRKKEKRDLQVLIPVSIRIKLRDLRKADGILLISFMVPPEYPIFLASSSKFVGLLCVIDLFY